VLFNDSAFWAIIGTLVGGAIGAMSTWRVSRSQIKSNSRQDWLDTVRAKIARFTLLCTMVQENIPKNRPVTPGTIEEMRELFFELHLYLNPKKELQRKILEDLSDSQTASAGDDFQKFGESLVKLTLDSQNLVNEVWSKIKKGY
jgi:phosphoenolpyruvate-protein kinase (PTS system EI component)